MLIYKLSTPTGPGEKQGDGPYDDNTGSKGRPGVTAGIALGSISGFALLLFLIFYGAKMHKRRRQRQVRGSDEHASGQRDGDGGDASDTPFASSANKNRVDLREADPIVRDFAAMGLDRRTPSAVRPKEIVAASTGAEWKTGNPGTPRVAGDSAPKPGMTNGAHSDAWDDIPNTPTLLVQHPESVAQNLGLGERAWHRRRLSAPLPPPGYRYSDGSVAFGGGGSSRAAEETPSQGAEDGRRLPWEDDWDALMPAPLTLPPLGHDASGPSTSAAEDGGPLTAKTMWTVCASDASLSRSSLESAESRARTGTKTGKTE